ncbi:MAG: hypothetical protein ACPGJV_08640 [Bacteriovoracaceae bacterium]
MIKIMKFKPIALLILGFIGETYASSCPEGMYRVQGHYRQAHYRNGKYVKGANVSPHCKHYRSDGPLKPEFKLRMPKGWPQKKEKFKKCSKKNQKKINKALSTLPKILTNIGKLKIHCADRSVYLGNPASSAPNVKIIVLYDSAFSGDVKRYIAHELAHILYTRLSDEEKKILHKVSSWTEDKNGRFKTKRKKFSEPDGAIDPDEDFSNNVEHYLFNKRHFRRDYPEIFKWLKNLFGDKK